MRFLKTCSAALEKESGADMKIYNVGSVNVDHVYQVPHFVRAGETLASASLQQFPGGKGLNQSVALGKAGADVRHCALLNAADTWLIDVLREAKVDVSRIHRVSEPTGHAIIQVDETGQNCILLYPGANHCFTSSHFEQALDDAKEGDILLLQNEINGLAELFTLAHSKGMQIAWNPSPFDRSLLDLPLEYVTWWVVNETEGSGLTGLNAPEEILDAMSSRFPHSNVILTVGKNGSYFRNAEQRFHVPAVPTEAVDTTAAGDTFTGYFLAMIAKGKTITEALQIATKAAAISVSRKGAAVSIPWAQEVL